MLWAFLWKWGVVDESQCCESNFQVKSKSQQGAPESNLWQVYSNIFSALDGDNSDAHSSSVHQQTNHRFFLHRSIKGRDDNARVLHEAEKGEAITSFLKLFRSTPTTSFCPPTQDFLHQLLRNYFFLSFPLIIWWLMTGLVPHICLVFSQALTVQGSSSSSPFCGHEVAVPPCGTGTPRQR